MRSPRSAADCRLSARKLPRFRHPPRAQNSSQIKKQNKTPALLLFFPPYAFSWEMPRASRCPWAKGQPCPAKLLAPTILKGVQKEGSCHGNARSSWYLWPRQRHAKGSFTQVLKDPSFFLSGLKGSIYTKDYPELVLSLSSGSGLHTIKTTATKCLIAKSVFGNLSMKDTLNRRQAFTL